MMILIQPKAGGYSELLNKPAFPLALLNCARFLDEKFEVKIMDQRLTPRWKKILLNALNQNPICVGITSITGKQIEYALEISRFVKKNSDVPVVWGGVHASLLPKQTLENPYVDIIVKGEGEVTFFELVKALEKGKSLKGIKGVWYKKNCQIKSNPDRPFTDLKRLPRLPCHLVDVKQYIQKRGHKKSLHVQTSRGCPYSCKFCFNQVYYKSHLRVFSQNQVLNSLFFFKNLGINHFWIVDDNFFADVKRATDLCKNIIAEKLDFSWEVPGSNVADMLRFKNFNLLEKSGCEQLYLGVESGSNSVLKYINKNITREQVLGFNEVIKKFNIYPLYNFMVGFPNETRDDTNLTLGLILKLLKENKKARISPIYSFTPYPGTKLFDEALKAGFVSPSMLEGWSLYDWKTMNIPWVTEKQKKYFEKLYFWSLFLDDKYRFELANPVLKANVKLFLPIFKKIAVSKVKNF